MWGEEGLLVCAILFKGFRNGCRKWIFQTSWEVRDSQDYIENIAAWVLLQSQHERSD